MHHPTNRIAHTIVFSLLFDPLPYVKHHKTVNKMCQHFLSSFFCIRVDTLCYDVSTPCGPIPLIFVIRPLSIDHPSFGVPKRSFHSHWHSSLGHRDTQPLITSMNRPSLIFVTTANHVSKTNEALFSFLFFYSVVVIIQCFLLLQVIREHIVT